MFCLYVCQNGCYLCLEKETILVKQKEKILTRAQLPQLEQILIFGKSQITTQVICSCLLRNIPIAYLSPMGYCYGRILPIERGYRQLIHYQQQLTTAERLLTARAIVQGKLKNSRVLLLRQQRKQPSENLESAIAHLDYLSQKAHQAETISQLMGYEGTAANIYFAAFGECFSNCAFVFLGRSRRPPGNPVNAMLSFGYQLLWNHLLALIEIEGLDPYCACLHQDSERHAALVSDLLEEFRAPIVDSLVLWLVNSKYMNSESDFEYKNGGCYLNNQGRQKYLKAFVRKMEEKITTLNGEEQPRWSLLAQQVKLYKQFVYKPSQGYQPYLIR